MRARSRLMWALSLAVVGILLAPTWAAAQQKTIHQRFVEEPISVFDPHVYDGHYGSNLALALPRYLHRPIDDLTPRAGAEALGRGGAYTAAVEGPLALAWNPAAMANLRELAVYTDSYLRSSTSSGSGLPDTILVEGLGEFSISSYESALGGRDGFGFWGAALPLFELGGRPVVGGAAYRAHSTIDFGTETVLEMGLFSAGGTGFPFVLGVDNEEKGAINSLTLGLAYEPVSSRTFSLAAGASANVLTGRLRSNVLLRAAVRNFDEGMIAFERDMRGLSIQAGFLATLREKLQLGAWVELPHTIESYDSRIESQPLILPDVTEVDHVHWEIADYDMEIPLFYTLGIALGPIRGIEVSADYNVRPWSEVEIKHADEAFAAFDQSYPASDVESFHVGGRFEFPLLRRKLRDIGLRLMTQLGYRTMPLSMQHVDLDAGGVWPSGDQVEGSATAFGFSLETTANITFHLGLEFQNYDVDSFFLLDGRSADSQELQPGGIGQTVVSVDRDVQILRLSSEFRL